MTVADITNETQVTEQNYNDILKFAQDGNATAQFVLGLYFFDNGESEEAMRWLTKAAEQNYAKAQIFLGDCFQYGEETEADEFKAFELYSKAAETGDVEAQFILGFCYQSGIGVTKNEAKAFELYLEATKMGSVGAQNNLAICYENGIGTEKDEFKAFELYLDSAEKEEANAQANLGRCYENGIGTQRNEVKAFEWYEKAAEQGHSEAQNCLGLCYENGIGTQRNEVKAFEWYEKAAEQGLDVAQYNLGICYENGIGIERDEAKAFGWYEKAAEQGFDVAQYNLGICYKNGIGTEKNEVKAFELFQNAAEQGLDVAQYNLGHCYENGIGTEKDETKAFEWWSKAAEQGIALAQYNLGRYYDDGICIEKNEAKAFEWYLKATEQELDLAQNSLGLCYEAGKGTEKDEEKAFSLYLEATRNSYSVAQYNLGRCYYKGFGTEKDEFKAFELYLKAAEQGLDFAQYNLGCFFREGIGTEKDEYKAFEWNLKAAEQGLPEAQRNLGTYYYNGIGTDKDENKALEWWVKASEQGLTIAQYTLGLLYLSHFKDYENAEKYLLKVSEDEEFSDSYNWLAVSCFAQKRNKEGFDWAKKSADLDDALGCFILSSAYYHGKGIEKDATNGDLFYKRAIDKGLALESEDALALDPITEVKTIDFEKLYSEESYLTTLLNSNLFPKTDFILAKMQKMPSLSGALTAESVKGTMTRALHNILGLRPLLMEEKLKKEKSIDSTEPLLVGGDLLSEYYTKKLETLDYTKTDDPSMYMDYQIRNARSSIDDHWDYNKYKEIKKVFDALAKTNEGIKALENESYSKEILAEMFPERGPKAIDNLYLDLKEEYIRRTSSTISISPSDDEEEQQIDIKDESELSPEEAFIQKEEHSEKLLKLRQFVKGFDDTLRKGTSKETATVFMIRLLVPSPAKDTGVYEQKMGLTAIVRWTNMISKDFTIDEIKSILSETKFFAADIDWFCAEQLEGKRALKNEEIAKHLGIEPAAFTRTYNKTLIPKLIEYWNSHKTEFEGING